MLKYADVLLLEPPESLRSWIAQNIDVAELWQFTTFWWPGKNLSHLPFRPPAIPRKVELNTLWWPTGASRFAVGWFLADQPILDAIRAYVYEDPTETTEGQSREDDYRAADLVIDDGYSSVTAEMWMLPPVPLQQTGADGFYLVPLVDERYFWWYRAAAISVDGGTTTWEQLYADIADALGIALDVDAVEAAYLTPSATLGTQYESLPLLLDAVAYSTGRRIVRDLDGTVRAWNPASSLTQAALSIAAVEDKLAGGLLSISATGYDETPQVPASVTVTAFRTDAGVLSQDLHAETVTLLSLALPEFDGIIGFVGSRVFHTSAVALYPGPSNAAALASLAQQVARDWYLWQAARVSLALVGYPGWTLTGLDDALLLRHEMGQVFTRVLRASYDVEMAELLVQDGSVIVDPDSLTVEQDDLSVIVTQVNTIQFEAHTLLVTEVAAGVAHVALGCRTVRPIAGPPPWTAPADVCCNEDFTDGVYYGIYLCNYGFIYFCQCFTQSGSGSGSGSVGGCIPGICSLCAEPPYTWTIPIAGFTGDCDIFNGDWTLSYVAPCTWKAADIVNGLACTVTLTLGVSNHTIDFSGYTPSGALVTSGYLASTSALPNCCFPITFNSNTCSCDIANAVTPCGDCPTTPEVWTVDLSGFTGCYARLNGTWALPQEADQPCCWRLEINQLDFRLCVAGGAVTFFAGDYLAREVGGVASYASYSAVLPDCCADVIVDLEFAACPESGDTPSNITLSPQCVGGGGTCPSSLNATPVCCTDLPPDTPVCDCPQCPLGMPPRWLLETPFATGVFGDARGAWTLVYVSGCKWQQTRGDVTCVLDYTAAKNRWFLTFTSAETGSTWEMVDDSPFNCCSQNTFVVNGPQPNPYFGSVGETATIFRGGPCEPCGGGGGVATSCCPGFDLPSTLRAVFSDGTGSCTCLNGKTLDLTLGGGGFQGFGAYYGVCGGTDTSNAITLDCGPVGWTLANVGFFGGRCSWGIGNLVSAFCNPFELVFEVAGESMCCSGGWKVTIFIP